MPSSTRTRTAASPSVPPVAPRSPAPRRRSRSAGRLSDGDRQRYIAEAAYFKAEQRGFAQGSELADWIEAEAEIDALLNSRGAG